jgi:putative heme-binding domain-containing protein
MLGAKPEAVAALAEVVKDGKSADARRNALWAATRIDSAAARGLVRSALEDAEDMVRQVALHSISLRRDREAVPGLIKMLKSQSMHNRRAAAEALGRISDKSAVPALLEATAARNDQILAHSLTYALIEIGDREGTAAGLKAQSAPTRRAALTALDQMDDSKLQPATVAAELASADPSLKETAWWIASCHSGWGAALAGFLKDRLEAKNLAAAQEDELVSQLARFASSPAIQVMLSKQLLEPKSSVDSQRLVLLAMARAGLRESPQVWIDALARVLDGENKEVIAQAVNTARAFAMPKKNAENLTKALLKVANSEKNPVAVRLTALASAPGGLSEMKPELFAFLRDQLDREQPVLNRTLAADVLARAKLTAMQLGAVAEALKTTGPMEAGRLLDAFIQSSDPAVGRSLVAALKAAPVRSSLRVAVLKPVLDKFGEEVKKQAEELYASLEVDSAKQKAHLEELVGTLGAGDIRRGQAIFNSTKAACSSCHAVGYLGGNIGPDLTSIGKIRNEHDLLESIVYPSSSFVRGYEPVSVTTKSGKVHNGVVRKDTPEELVLALDATHEVRLGRTDIEEIQPSKVSIMPAGLEQQITRQELADLVAFLKACK